MSVSSIGSGTSLAAAYSAGRAQGAGQEEVVRERENDADADDAPARAAAMPAEGTGKVLDKTV